MSDELNLCISNTMHAVRELIAKAAGTNATVLLQGESGVGKEIVARALHGASPRANRPFVEVRCGALPDELLEVDLFGHQKGAPGDPHRRRAGKLEAADGGTLLLDEIGEMPLRLQARLLRVLRDGEFSRVGGRTTIGTDVRLIAATNRDLEAAMRSRQLREELYYWLTVIEIRIPPLRERREEIPGLVEHFRRKFTAQYARKIEIPPDTVRLFMQHHWPGNVRELENAVERMVMLGSAAPVHQEIQASLPRAPHTSMPPALAVAATIGAGQVVGLKDIARQAAREAERAAIHEVLDRVDWNRAKAARLLRISYKALLYKIVQCGLVTADVKGRSVRAPIKEVIAS